MVLLAGEALPSTGPETAVSCARRASWSLTTRMRANRRPRSKARLSQRPFSHERKKTLKKGSDNVWRTEREYRPIPLSKLLPLTRLRHSHRHDDQEDRRHCVPEAVATRRAGVPSRSKIVRQRASRPCTALIKKASTAPPSSSPANSRRRNRRRSEPKEANKKGQPFNIALWGTRLTESLPERPRCIDTLRLSYCSLTPFAERGPLLVIVGAGQ